MCVRAAWRIKQDSAGIAGERPFMHESKASRPVYISPASHKPKKRSARIIIFLRGKGHDIKASNLQKDPEQRQNYKDVL
jgi:hypothetical protein